jgi:endo-1,4-beta-xylanase
VSACGSGADSEVLVASDAHPREFSLKQSFAGAFYVGAALSDAQITGRDQASLGFIAGQFNALTAENAMKWQRIQPQEGIFAWEVADALARFGESAGMHLTGHTLVWHQQTPRWVFEDRDGNPASRELLLRRMQTHIETVVGRYKGTVRSWDVVNEALNEDGTLRSSKWRDIIGDDYIDKAFEFAHGADPGALLYYNDFNLYKPQKRSGVLRLVSHLQERGIAVHGVGMQGHFNLQIATGIDQVRDSIDAFAELGVDVMITELDLSVLPWPDGESQGANIETDVDFDARYNPYVDGVPANVEAEFTAYYADLFRLFMSRKDRIGRVTFWGVNDAQSWRNNGPVRGRTDHALLFDRNNRPKPALFEVLNTSDLP